MANKVRDKARRIRDVISRLFTGCSSASTVGHVEMPRQQEVIQVGERELNRNQRAQLIVQDMIQQGLSYSDYDSYMERYHGDLAVPTRTDLPVFQLTKSPVGTGPTASLSIPTAPRANPVSPCGVPAPFRDGSIMPAPVQAIQAITDMDAYLDRFLGGDVALPVRRDLPVFQLPTKPTVSRAVSVPLTSILAPLTAVPARDKVVPVTPKVVQAPAGVVPISPKAVPAAAGVIAVPLTAVPAPAGVVPVTPKAVPAPAGVVPVTPKTVPAPAGVIPVMPKAVPAPAGVVPVTPKAVPAPAGVVPVALTAVPAPAGVVPVMPKAVPARDEVVPVRPKAVPAPDGAVRDIDSFIHNFNASLAPAPSSAISVPPAGVPAPPKAALAQSKAALAPAKAALAPAKAALAPTKAALVIPDFDTYMHRLYGDMAVPVRTSLPVLKLPIALGTVPTAPRAVPTVPVTLTSVPTAPRAIPTVPVTLTSVPMAPRAIPTVPVTLTSVPMAPRAIPTVPVTLTSVPTAPRAIPTVPVTLTSVPAPARSVAEPPPSTAIKVTSVPIPQRWDIPVFLPAGASPVPSAPRPILPGGASPVVPGGAATVSVPVSALAGQSKLQIAQFIVQQLNEGALSLSEMDSLIDNFNVNYNAISAGPAQSSPTAVIPAPVQIVPEAFSFSAAQEPSDPVLELALGLIPARLLRPLQAGFSLA